MDNEHKINNEIWIGVIGASVVLVFQGVLDFLKYIFNDTLKGIMPLELWGVLFTVLIASLLCYLGYKKLDVFIKKKDNSSIIAREELRKKYGVNNQVDKHYIKGRLDQKKD